MRDWVIQPSKYLSKPYESSPLLVLLDGYFHPDWKLDDPDSGAVIDSFVESASPATVLAVVHDIEEVIDDWRDPSLRDLIDMHLKDLSRSDRLGLAPPQWLLWLRSRLQPPDRHADFLRDKRLVMSRSVPSSGDDLLGMQIDFDAYLGEPEIFTSVDVQRSGAAEEMLVARCTIREGISLEAVAPELEWIWLHELRYGYFESHVVARDADIVTLDFVTQIGADGFYVTGRIEAIR